LIGEKRRSRGGFSGNLTTTKSDTRAALFPGRRCLLIFQSLDFLQSSILRSAVVLTRK